jgi:hypothetical protein
MNVMMIGASHDSASHTRPIFIDDWHQPVKPDWRHGPMSIVLDYSRANFTKICEF